MDGRQEVQFDTAVRDTAAASLWPCYVSHLPVETRGSVVGSGRVRVRGYKLNDAFGCYKSPERSGRWCVVHLNSGMSPGAVGTNGFASIDRAVAFANALLEVDPSFWLLPVPFAPKISERSRSAWHAKLRALKPALAQVEASFL